METSTARASAFKVSALMDVAQMVLSVHFIFHTLMDV